MKNDNGAYIDPQTSDLWISWQASREAMRPIKLPKTVMVKLSPVEPVVRLAIASGSNPDLWHIMDSAAVSLDEALKYYELTKV